MKELFELVGKTTYTSNGEVYEVYIVLNLSTGYRRAYTPEDYKEVFGGKLE